MGYNSIPPRWEEYSKVGKLIPGTKIIPFKVPLRKEICNNLKDASSRFTVEDLIEECKDLKLSLVIDLTQTNRFYNGEELEKYDIKHVKFSTKGGGIMPSNYEIKTFCDTIHNHLEDNPDTVVGVHCTHGLNRTGYFICRYMIDYLGISGLTSVNLFEECRGHTFDRDNYREFLINRVPTVEFKNASSVSKEDKVAHFANGSPVVRDNTRKRQFSEEKSSVSSKNYARISRSFNDGAKRSSKYDYSNNRYDRQYDHTGYGYNESKNDYYDEDYSTPHNSFSNYTSYKADKERKNKSSHLNKKSKYDDRFQFDN